MRVKLDGHCASLGMNYMHATAFPYFCAVIVGFDLFPGATGVHMHVNWSAAHWRQFSLNGTT